MSSTREFRGMVAIIRAPSLRLIKLAEYHARSPGEVRSEQDIFAELLTAFWRGELTDTYLSGSSKRDRSDILRVVGLVREHPRFTLVEREEDLVQKSEEHKDGSVSLHPKPILLPRDTALWTDKIRNVAYAEFATRSIEDFADPVKVILYALAVPKQTYGEYCNSIGLPRPPFWFGAGRELKPNKWSERELRNWLKRIFAGPWKAKADVVAEAQQAFPGVSQAGVKRAWRESAPPSWRAGGAPGKKSLRGLTRK